MTFFMPSIEYADHNPWVSLNMEMVPEIEQTQTPGNFYDGSV